MTLRSAETKDGSIQGGGAAAAVASMMPAAAATSRRSSTVTCPPSSPPPPEPLRAGQFQEFQALLTHIAWVRTVF